MSLALETDGVYRSISETAGWDSSLTPRSPQAQSLPSCQTYNRLEKALPSFPSR